jgi:hypothetical protein
MNISDILPAYGPYDQSINITIFGSGFEIAICKKIICKFNEQQTNGIFIDLNEIICPTPLKNNHLSIVSIALIIDKKIIQPGIYFKFISPLFIIDDGTTLTKINSSNTEKIRTNYYQLIIIILFTFIL